MSRPRRLDIEQHPIFKRALFDEFQVRFPDLRPVRVIDQDVAPFGKVRLGQGERVELIFVRPRAVEQVHPQRFLVVLREVLSKVSFVKVVARPARFFEPSQK